MNWDWSQFIDVRVIEGQVAAAIGPLVWILALVVLAGWLVWQRPWWLRSRRLRVTEVTLTLPWVTLRIERNRQTAELAHEAYVELITRKAALKFDEENDVLTEIYDSWYELFGEVRRLTRQIDADDLAANPDLRRLHDLLVAVLNEGLRPHLTRWHARFRGWYTTEADRRPDASPQDIQRAYPAYDELVASLLVANRLLIELAAKLRELGHGESGS